MIARAIALLGAVGTALPPPPALPPARLAIAEQVALAGGALCQAVEPDGRASACAVHFRAAPGREVNAWAAGSEVAISTAAAARLSDAEFALLAAHEVAHLRLHHTRIDPANELAADRLGAQLACRAGYDPARGAGLFRHLRAGATHPSEARRRAAVRSVPCALANSFTIPR